MAMLQKGPLATGMQTYLSAHVHDNYNVRFCTLLLVQPAATTSFWDSSVSHDAPEMLRNGESHAVSSMHAGFGDLKRTTRRVS